jgi:hypothetical protein
LFLRVEIKGPTVIRCDNTAAIALAKCSSLSTRTKHIEVASHYVRQCLLEGSVEICHVGTKANLADFFTKPLCAEQLKVLVKAASIC